MYPIGIKTCAFEFATFGSACLVYLLLVVWPMVEPGDSLNREGFFTPSRFK